jgi:hypothetical protein
MTCNHDGPRLPWSGFDALCTICGCFLIDGDQEAWRRLPTNQQQSLQRYGAQIIEKQAWNSSGGVYVYSYPQYLTYPRHPDGRTLYKVGKADRVIKNRIDGQVRFTAMPEDPVLLRVYGPADAEHRLHQELRSLGHHHAGRLCGEEWFLTDPPTLDLAAGRCDMTTSYNHHQLQQHLQEQLQEQEQLRQQQEEAS